MAISHATLRTKFFKTGPRPTFRQRRQIVERQNLNLAAARLTR